MLFHTKEGTVFMVQVDHLTGEQIGYAINRFYDAGASNVQVVSSITKKNRPSYIFFIDCREEHRTSVEEVIPEELGAGGWHIIRTEHHYLYNDSVERTVRIAPENAEPMTMTVLGKRFENGNLRPEHETVLALQEAIYENYGRHVCYTRLYHSILDALVSEDDDCRDLTTLVKC